MMSARAVRYQVCFAGPSGLLDADLTMPVLPGPHPALALVGATPGQRDRGGWVRDLAQAGFAVLTWDSPGWGGSVGPRSWQAPADRTLEVAAAADFLHRLPDVLPGRVAVVGSDSGAWAVALAAALSSRVAALALLAPPCTGILPQQLHRLAQRLRAQGFISAEIGLAQLVLAERVRHLAEGQDVTAVIRAEAPCRHAPWYGELPGLSPAELAGLASLRGYDPTTVLAPVACPVLGVFGADDPATPAGENAELLHRALLAVPGRDHEIHVLPRTDDAFCVSSVASGEDGLGTAPLLPGDWRPEVVTLIGSWLASRLGLHRATGPVAAFPRAG